MAWSTSVTIVAAAGEPLAVAAVKEFLRIDGDDEDGLIATFIASARSHVEDVCGIRLAAQTVQLQADEWADLLALPIGPVSAVAGIAYDDGDGVEQVLDPAVYELVGTGLATGIRTGVGKGWPTGVRRAQGAIRVTLQVGYVSLPESIGIAMLLMCGDLYKNRETGVVGMGAAEIRSSMRVHALLSNYRIYR